MKSYFSNHLEMEFILHQNEKRIVLETDHCPDHLTRLQKIYSNWLQNHSRPIRMRIQQMMTHRYVKMTYESRVKMTYESYGMTRAAWVICMTYKIKLRSIYLKLIVNSRQIFTENRRLTNQDRVRKKDRHGLDRDVERVSRIQSQTSASIGLKKHFVKCKLNSMR